MKDYRALLAPEMKHEDALLIPPGEILNRRARRSEYDSKEHAELRPRKKKSSLQPAMRRYINVINVGTVNVFIEACRHRERIKS